MLSGFVNPNAQHPEVVVIFVEQEAQPAREAYSFLQVPQIIYQKTAIRINRTHLHFLNQTFLDSASSSLVVPYAYPSASVSDAILNKVAHPAILSALSSDEAVLVRQHDSNRPKSELLGLKDFLMFAELFQEPPCHSLRR